MIQIKDDKNATTVKTQLFTGTNEHDGVEVKPETRQITMYDLMNMPRKDRRAFGKRNGVKIPGLSIQIKPKDFVKEASKFFMKPDAKISSVLDISDPKA